MNLDHDPSSAAVLSRSRMRRRRRWILGLLGAAGAFALCHPWQQEAPAVGRVAPHQWSVIRTHAPGVVHRLSFGLGDFVEEGEVVARVDATALRESSEAARLDLDREHAAHRNHGLAIEECELRLQEVERQLGKQRDALKQAPAFDTAALTPMDPELEAMSSLVRDFISHVRSDLSRSPAQRRNNPWDGKPYLQGLRRHFDAYLSHAEKLARSLGTAATPLEGIALEIELEQIRYAFLLAEQTMQEIQFKNVLVRQDLLAPIAFRELLSQLEREFAEMSSSLHGFRLAAFQYLERREELVTSIREAEQEVALLRNERTQLENERASHQHSVHQATLAWNAARRREAHAEILAPISGTITQLELVEQDPVGSHAAIGVVEDQRTLSFKARVTDSWLDRVRPGQQVSVGVPTSSGYQTVSGVVDWIVAEPGQLVKDQDWNVLVTLDEESNGLPVGVEGNASIQIGKRSLLRRGWDRVHGGRRPVVEPRIAEVTDPTRFHGVPEPRERFSEASHRGL